jgi:hypothetical protein
MHQGSQTQSARIYQFPASRVRAAAQAVKPTSQPRPVGIAPSPATSTSFGSGWYHEAAIEEARRTKS